MNYLTQAQVNDLLNFLAPRPFNEVSPFMNALSGALQGLDESDSDAEVSSEVLEGLREYMLLLPYGDVSNGITWIDIALNPSPSTDKPAKAPK